MTTDSTGHERATVQDSRQPAGCSRRAILKWAPCGVLGGLALRTAGATDAAPMPSLRKLAAGRPLIGVAVPTRFETRFTPAELRLLESQFDSVTPENCMKWDQMCPAEGEYRFDDPDRLIKYAADHGQKVVGHCLVFNRNNEVPKWLFRDGDAQADKKLVWKRIESHMAKVMTRYKGRIDSWDVLNEFVEVKPPYYRHTDLTRVLGPDFPQRLFKLAAQLDPAVKLTYNDYRLENAQRRKLILDFVRSLQKKGCRIDVVGSQSHLELADDIGDQIAATIKDFAALGVRCALTELDIDVISRRAYWNPKTRPEAIKQNPYVDGCPADVLRKQAQRYGAVFDAVTANRKHVDRVTFWGLSDKHSWLNTWPWKRVNHGLVFDRDAKPKPAFGAIAKALSRR